MTCQTNHIDQNQNSDFVILERFVLKGEPQPVDAFNWKLKYTTGNYIEVVAEHRDGVFTNCIKNDDTSVLVIFDNPQFGTGELLRTAYIEYPNPVFPDGIENIVIPERTGIEITRGPSSGDGRHESQVILDYVQGKNGHSPYFNEETQTWWEFNDESGEYRDTGISSGGGISRLEFDAAVERIDEKDEEQDGKISALETDLADVREIAGGSIQKPVFDATIERVDQKDIEQDGEISEIRIDLIEVREIAEGAAKGLVFETEQQLMEWLAGTYERPDGVTPADLIVGQHLLIEELSVPDYWWTGTDVSPLETQKVDLSDYYNKEQADARFAMKTDLATLSQTVSQIQIDISGVEDAVTIIPQSLTPAQQAQARTNINAGTSNFSGAYNDLSGRPSVLPNPNALTFTGAATGVYDGSQPVSINVPQGGGGGSGPFVKIFEDLNRPMGSTQGVWTEHALPAGTIDPENDMVLFGFNVNFWDGTDSYLNNNGTSKFGFVMLMYGAPVDLGMTYLHSDGTMKRIVFLVETVDNDGLPKPDAIRVFFSGPPQTAAGIDAIFKVV